jgi:signal transduction histidine kinase
MTNESITASPGGASNPPPGPRPMDDPILVEQVKLLYANLPVSQTVALANGAVLALVHITVIELRMVVGWFAFLVLVVLARGAIGLRFSRAPASGKDILWWRAYFLVGAAASALVWGSTALVLYPPGSVVHQVFIAFVLGGMVAGATSFLTPVFPVFVLFALGTLAPVIVRFVLDRDSIHYAMAGMGTIFLLAMLAVGKRIHDTIAHALKLRFENRDLIAHLTSEKARVEHVNTELLKAQEELRKANEALESRVRERTAALQELDERKNDFLAMLSHELRNPLAPIRNSIYILDHVQPHSQQARHAIDVMARQTEHVTRLVDDLLDVTRIERGKIELRRETVDLAGLLARTLDDHRSTFRQLDVALKSDVPSAAVYADVDPTRMAQVIGNLLQNAAKFTPAGGHATVSLRAVDQWAEIRVSDTGSGISPELRPLLFQPFTQGQRTLARIEGGIGLGLAMVKGIVELHGGTVEAESGGTNKGATFIVRLPRIAGPRPGEEPAAPVQVSTMSRRVLIVDDNRDAADSLAQVVQMFGHSAEVAYDGESAIAKARALAPDIVLCDLGLPGMSGFDVARALRAERSDIQLIAVSGYARPDDAAAAASAGFDNHLAKPASAETLRRLLL